MSGLRPGQYVIGDSVLHRLDPRTKIIWCMAVVLLVLLSGNWHIIAITTVMLLAAIRLSGLGLKILRFRNGVAVFLGIIFVAQVFLSEGEPVFSLGPLMFSAEGLQTGVTTVFRLFMLYAWSNLMTMTTSPIRLASGLESLMTPLKYLRVPVQQLAMLISISLRFIPLIIEEAESITRAQRSRGAQLDSKNLIERIKSMLAVLIPLLTINLQRAEDLAIAMESRCYSGAGSRQRLGSLAYKLQDTMALAVLLSSLVLAFILM